MRWGGAWGGAWGAVDSAADSFTVEVVSPSTGAELHRFDSIILTVDSTDPVDTSKIQIHAVVRGVAELVKGSGGFLPLYARESSEAEDLELPNAQRYTLRRAGGWPTEWAGLEIQVSSI